MKKLYGIGFTLLALLACTGTRNGQAAAPATSSREDRVRARVFMEDSLPDSAAFYYKRAIAVDTSNEALLLEYCRALAMADPTGMGTAKEMERALDLYMPLAHYPAPVVVLRLGYHQVAGDSLGALSLLLKSIPYMQAQDSMESFVADMNEAGLGLYALNLCYTANQVTPKDKALLEVALALHRAFHVDGGEAYYGYMHSLYMLDTLVLEPLRNLASYESEYYYYDGLADSAQKHWKRYAQLDTGLSGKAMAYTALYRVAGNIEDTLALGKYGQEAMRLEPSNAAHPYSMVQYYVKLGNFQRAREVLEQAFKMPLDSASMGQLYYVQADALLDERSMLSQGDTAIYRKLSREYLHSLLGQVAYAEADYVSASVDGEYYDGLIVGMRYKNIAKGYAELGEADSAIYWYEKVPENVMEGEPFWQADLAYLLVETRRDLPRGKAMLEAILESDAEDVFAREAYGWALFRQGQLKEALRELEKVENSGEEVFGKYYLDQSRLWSHMAQVCEALHLKDRAKAYRQKALKSEAPSEHISERVGGST